MSNIRKLPPELGALLAALGLAKQITVEIDPNSPLSEDEQVQAAVDRQAADHRAECASCREEYEQEQLAAATADKANADVKPSANRRDPSRGDRRQAKDRAYESNDRTMRATGMHPSLGAGYGETSATTDNRTIVGYLAYVGDIPLHGTFGETHDEVVGAVTEFTGAVPNPNILVKPVYG